MLSVRPRYWRTNWRWSVLLLIAYAGQSVVFLIPAEHQHTAAALSVSGFLAALWLSVGLVTVLQQSLRFYEGGVRLPANPGPEKVPRRFLYWVQIERSSWDGNTLTLVGTQSTLKGGPVIGGTFLLKPDQRPQVELMLAQHLAPAA